MSRLRSETDGPQPASPLLASEADIPLTDTNKSGASTSVAAYSSPDVEHSQSLRRRKPLNESPTRTFLRSVGLKVLSSGKKLKHRRRSKPADEEPKVVESNSLLIAIASTSVHALPICITVFIILFNAIGFLNGPEITKSADFALQVASKLHELSIVGSLTVIAVDLIRYHLMRDGINLGLLTAGMSFASLNWLWSTDFISGFKASIAQRAKIFLLFILILLCALSSVVGPASALLFIPGQLWLPGPSTDFYLAGTDADLYPDKLTVNNTGPDYCRETPLRLEDQCLHAGWRTLYAEMESHSPVRPGWTFLIPGLPSRTVVGAVPDQHSGYTTGLETYAMSTTKAIASSMDNLVNQNGIAWRYATGRNRRLRDFVGGGGGFAITWGKMPVTRAVCNKLTLVTSDAQNKNETSNKLGFPILSRDEYWRSPDSIGPVQDIDVTTLDLPENWNGLQPFNLTHTQARAEFVTLPSSTGNSTSAGLIFITQNGSATYARGCAIDARWAQGENLRKFNAAFFSHESQPGKDAEPSDADYEFSRTDYMNERYKPYYGPSIEMTKEWRDKVIIPMPEATSKSSNLTQNLFEALLNASALSFPRWSEDNVDDSRIQLEYFISIFITDALSRIGWVFQTEGDASGSLKKSLTSPGAISDKFLNGGPIFDEPSYPHTTLHFQTYKYGTAWYLNSDGQKISIGIFAIYLFVALVHIVVVLWWRRSSEAWDSANELVALAYNSRPMGEGFENCGSGIAHMEPLKRMVRVTARPDDSGGKQVELVIVGEGGVVRKVEEEDVIPGEKYS